MVRWNLMSGIVLAVCLPVPSTPVSVSVSVGASVTLPCNGSAYRGTPEDQLYIRWQTNIQGVYEFTYGQLFPGPGFKNRTEIPLERIRQGDFSLSFQHTSFSDQEHYECYCECKGTDIQFLGPVDLSVTAHSDSLSLWSGAALSLRLFTAEPVEVLFAAAGEGASVSVCAVERGAASRPGPGYEHRVSVQSGSLTLRSLTAADQGNYTVRESGTNRTISTVSVTVNVTVGESGLAGWAIALIVILTLVFIAITTLLWKMKTKCSSLCEQGDRVTQGPGEMESLHSED
ncbi:uncharacterized protein LOC136771819 [Amia ocellicauda]|uniref:uncharacterized protein LOC136771819 n=1 Tax=Amia ocellicauda TaxID=2972642 RepID=UPI003464441F